MTGLLWFCLHLPTDGRQISQNTFPDPPPGQRQHSADQAHQTEWDKGRYTTVFVFRDPPRHTTKLKVFSHLGRRTSSDRTLSSSAAEALCLMLAVACSEKNRKRSPTRPWVFTMKGIRAACPSHRARGKNGIRSGAAGLILMATECCAWALCPPIGQCQDTTSVEVSNEWKTQKKFDMIVLKKTGFWGILDTALVMSRC